MIFSKIPLVEDVAELTLQERRGIMAIYEGKDASAEIEEKIRNTFLWAVISRSSDVHIVGKFDRISPVVTVSIRTSDGFIHELYDGEHGKFFENKMFQLTGTPQGGSTPSIVSTRFEINLPLHYAKKHGLVPKPGSPHYTVNVRVEFNRTFDGFSFVSRLLDQQKTPTLDELGFTKAMMHSLLPILKCPSGLVLVSGPTGSGKSTLLNAMLQYLNDGTRAMSTIEDPVEYRLGDGSIKQMQVGGDITFARGLRSVLRQDPDIIFLGEIRDTETMETAIQAAQTGHLVFSTIHANSAHETVSRAVDLCVDKEIDGGRIAGVLKFVIAQRLISRYEGTLTPRALTNNEINWMHINGIPIPRNFSEVSPEVKKGKMAVVEAIVINDDLKVLLRSGKAKNEDIYRLARLQAQYESLASCGMRGVESNGCLLKDCMEGLDNNSDARLYPGSRLIAAKEHDLQLSVVSMLIDAKIQETERLINTTKRPTDGASEDLFSCLERRSKRRDVIQPALNEERL